MHPNIYLAQYRELAPVCTEYSFLIVTRPWVVAGTPWTDVVCFGKRSSWEHGPGSCDGLGELNNHLLYDYFTYHA